MSQTESMIGKLKEVARHSAIYGVGSALQALIGFILIPLFTKHYTPEIYGVLSLLILCNTLAGAVFFMGGTSALSRFYYDSTGIMERRRIVGNCVTITVTGACIQVLLGLFLCRQLSNLLFNTSDYALHISVILGTSAITFTNNLFFILLRYARRSMQVVVVNLVSFVTGISLIVYFLLGLRLGVFAPVLGDFCNQSILCGLLLWITRDEISFVWSRNVLAALLKYGLPVMLAGLGYYLMTWTDRLLLKHFSTMSEVGIYSLGYRLGSAINILLIAPFGQIWAPMRMQYRTAVDALQLYKRVLTYYFVIGLTITACVGAFSPEVVTILARRPDYRQAGDIIPLIMLAQLLYGAVNIIDCGIAFSCRTMWYTYIYGGCVIVNIMLNVVLIPHWGAMGAAWAALGTFSLLVAVVFMVSNHFFRMEVEFGRLSRLFLGALVVLWLSQRLGSFSVVTVAAKCGLMVALLGFIGIWVLSTGERARLAGIVRSLALRAG